MALIRWEPVRELNTIQNEMNRLFNTFFEAPATGTGGGHPSRALRRWIPADGSGRDRRGVRPARRPARRCPRTTSRSSSRTTC